MKAGGEAAGERGRNLSRAVGRAQTQEPEIIT